MGLPEFAGLGLSLVSMGLLLALLVIFLGTWRKTKAPFTLGLVIFVGVLLLQDAARLVRSRELFPALVVVPEILQVLALMVLLYLATR
jgi:hypothetical protein